MKTILTISLFASLWVFSGVARSAIIVLDNTNGWQDFLEPGASIQQSDAPDTFSITGTSVEFAIGITGTAVFPGQTTIGNLSFGGSAPSIWSRTTSLFRCGRLVAIFTTPTSPTSSPAARRASAYRQTLTTTRGQCLMCSSHQSPNPPRSYSWALA